MQESAEQKHMERLRKAIEDRDWLQFSREHFRIVNFCRRVLFQGDRDALNRWYPVISSLLIWFFRGGKADWQEAERSMGGLELLLSLIGNFLNTRTLDEARAVVRRSSVDCEIIGAVARSPGGLKSGELARILGRKQNSVTNRLPGLEKMGLIVRSRIGKNSVVYPTPKGRGIAEKILKEAVVEVPDPAKTDTNGEESYFLDHTGQKRSLGDMLQFWPNVETHAEVSAKERCHLPS
ncbi:MAG: hypothetical protein ABFD97_18425 [Syntrophobacter sp.]